MSNCINKCHSVAGQSLNAYFNSNTIGSLITTAGNVGIGTTSPVYTLDVNGTINASGTINTNWIPSCTFTNNSTVGSNGIASFLAPNMPANTSVVSYFGKSLSVGNCASLGYIYAGANNAGSVMSLAHYGKGGGLFVNNDGNVGVNTTNPSYNLDVNGTSRFSGSLYGDNIIRANYNATISGVTSIRCSPQTNGSESSIGFYPNINEGGSVWVVGHNLGAMGANTFAIWNSAVRFSIGSTGNVNIPGALSKGSGTFDIEHPIVEGKRLVHSFIEGPRCDLIYRGTVQLVNGTANVNLDSDCVKDTDSQMTQGTFQALCANPVKYLHNNDSFDRIRGTISGNILTITCENTSSNDTIDWMVMAERKDSFINLWERTNSNGYLVTEY